MLDQIYRIQADTGERVANVVVMGTGEPMDNYDNLIRFIRILTDENGLGISQRKNVWLWHWKGCLRDQIELQGCPWSLNMCHGKSYSRRLHDLLHSRTTKMLPLTSVPLVTGSNYRNSFHPQPPI